jgi:hypothetical protein
VILAHGIEQEHLRTDATYNESLFILGINKLIVEKTDAIGTIARVLALYHDFRVATLKPPTRTPKQNGEHLPPAQPQMYHPENAPEEISERLLNLPPSSKNVTQSSQNVTQHEGKSKSVSVPALRPPNPLYVAPHRRSFVTPPPPLRRPGQDNNHLKQMEWVTNNYTSLYESLPGATQPPKTKRKIRNRVVDPTTPWNRTAEGPV